MPRARSLGAFHASDARPGWHSQPRKGDRYAVLRFTRLRCDQRLLAALCPAVSERSLLRYRAGHWTGDSATTPHEVPCLPDLVLEHEDFT
jgi:hypothetical protein